VWVSDFSRAPFFPSLFSLLTVGGLAFSRPSTSVGCSVTPFQTSPTGIHPDKVDDFVVLLCLIDRQPGCSGFVSTCFAVPMFLTESSEVACLENLPFFFLAYPAHRPRFCFYSLFLFVVFLREPFTGTPFLGIQRLTLFSDQLSFTPPFSLVSPGPTSSYGPVTSDTIFCGKSSCTPPSSKCLGRRSFILINR